MANRTVTSDQVRAVWDTNAAHWDERMGEGNTFHLQLVEPGMLELLELRRGERVLEIACGNGQFARKLASLGAHVLATDFSPNMIERARAPHSARVAILFSSSTLRAVGRSIPRRSGGGWTARTARAGGSVKPALVVVAKLS